MDFSAISSAVKTIGGLLTTEVTSLRGVKDQVEDLQRELTWMQSFLKKAAARKVDDAVVRTHVAEIRELAYDAEDVIETFALKTKCEIERITARITNLTRRLQTYKLDDETSRDQAGSSCSNQRQELRRPYPHVPDDNIVGLADDIKTLVPLLIDEESDCRVVSICGMGVDYDRKRSDEELAEKLYNFLKGYKCLVILDDIWSTEAWDLLKPAFPVVRDMKSKFLLTSRNKVVSHADRRGHLYELQCLNDEQSWELFQKIAFPQTGNTIDARMERFGKEMIRHCAGLPLAIIVLGGVLATKKTVYEWQMVLDNLKRGKRSSTHDVLALSYDDLPPYLRPCFLYLSVFPEDYEIEADRLVELWVAEGIVSSEEDGGEIMEDVAELRLFELVERCMLQVGRRSPTSKIETCRMHDLMRELCLSIAKKEDFLCIIDDPSFLPPDNRAVRRIVSHQPFLFGRIKSYPLRSMLFFHNSFQLDALAEAFLSPKMFKYREEHMEDVNALCNLVLLNAFLLWKLRGCWRYLFNSLKLCRVLDFANSSGNEAYKVPSSIGNLIHLRFLNLRTFKFIWPWIPTSIGNLRCLQTLDLRISNDGPFYGTVYIPNVIWKLEQLRHLYLPEEMHEKTKLKLHTLRNLQTLVNFNTENCFATHLSKLTNLRKLKFSGSLNMEDFKENLDKNQPIITSQYLQSLSIWSRFENMIDPELLGHILSSCVNLCELTLKGKMKKLPESHHFPSSIAYIRFQYCKLEEDPMPTLEKLSSLRILELGDDAFMGKKLVTSAPYFPQLESLAFDWLRQLEEWKVEEGAMPALRHLKIRACGNLEMLPDGLRFITTLQELKIERMPKQFKDKMVQGGQDFYKVQHVPSVIFSNIL
ncbi:hypothetical protein V6N11_068521 [Hibiscus sabdariffa]|uniref:Uncharacterized protein n=1 Tax=Hibiscus sabdariffa TaxID=183260 RepID=A0ABR2P9Y7_9ROSI